MEDLYREREIKEIWQTWVEDAHQNACEIRVQQKTLQGLCTHFWRRFAPPEMGGEFLERNFVGRVFIQAFWERFPGTSPNLVYFPLTTILLWDIAP